MKTVKDIQIGEWVVVNMQRTINNPEYECFIYKIDEHDFYDDEGVISPLRLLCTWVVVDWFEDPPNIYYDGTVPEFLQLGDKSNCSCDIVDLMKSGCNCGHLTRFQMFL